MKQRMLWKRWNILISVSCVVFTSLNAVNGTFLWEPSSPKNKIYTLLHTLEWLRKIDPHPNRAANTVVVNPSRGTTTCTRSDVHRKLGTLQLKFKSFEEALEIYYDVPILVSFTSSLCGPCRVMKKEMEQVRHILQENVIMFTIDTDRFPSLGSKYGVKGLPCTMMFKKGLPILKFQGVKAAHDIIQQIQQFLPDC